MQCYRTTFWVVFFLPTSSVHLHPLSLSLSLFWTPLEQQLGWAPFLCPLLALYHLRPHTHTLYATSSRAQSQAYIEHELAACSVLFSSCPKGWKLHSVCDSSLVQDCSWMRNQPTTHNTLAGIKVSWFHLLFFVDSNLLASLQKLSVVFLLGLDSRA